MIRAERLWLYGVLLVLGACWGLTQPLSKIAVSEGYRHLGLVFWQTIIGAVLLTGLCLIRGKRLPFEPQHLRLYALLAVIGTLIPNSASYEAAVHLPSGILSILLSLVPLIAFPIAMGLGMDRFGWQRLLGLLLGLCGVALIALPEASLPERAMVVFLPLALIAPLFYAIEGNVVAKWGTAGLDPIQTLAGTSWVCAAMALPLAVGTGHWISPLPPYGAPDLAAVLLATVHAAVYASYLWLVARAGSVFAAQTGYLVTGCGVLWAMALLGERFGPTVWLAMAAMLTGVFLVQPRQKPQAAKA
ncbi:MAG: DMT family transporter [Pseudomonadota bacterium]